MIDWLARVLGNAKGWRFASGAGAVLGFTVGLVATGSVVFAVSFIPVGVLVGVFVDWGMRKERGD